MKVIYNFFIINTLIKGWSSKLSHFFDGQVFCISIYVNDLVHT